ncbi:transposase [bacterium]|nr:transposase [bacterium]
MPKNPKCFFNNTVIELCSSIQEGLPLATTAYLAVIIEGILAAAAKQCPVTICHYMFMGNHFHLIAIVNNPEDVPRFMRYIKCELSHAINRLLGRSQRNVWVSDYDSIVILDLRKALERIAYLYLNPVSADLVEKVSEYPGVSSYQALLKGQMTKSCKNVSRDAILPLPEAEMSLAAQADFADSLLKGKGKKYSLTVSPWAFLACFKRADNTSVKHFKEELLKTISDREHGQKIRRKRPVLGAHALKLRSIKTSYSSKRSGLKMFCISSNAELRTAFITWFKDRVVFAREAFLAWKFGNFQLRPPPGFFSPGGSLLASALLPFQIA